MDSWQVVLELYDDLIAQCDRFDRKGKTMPHTSANGHMFSMINKDAELGIRLAKEAQEEFKRIYNSTIFKSHGAVMKDYVLVPERLFKNKKLLVDTLNESYDYVMSLPKK